MSETKTSESKIKFVEIHKSTNEEERAKNFNDIIVTIVNQKIKKEFNSNM